MSVPPSIQRNSALAEKALRVLFAQQSSALYHLMEYQLGWRDEGGVPLDAPPQQTWLHANLCLLTAQSVGGDPERALSAAAAVELVHQFAQVHADIQDGSQQRYDRPTVWWIWGPAQAINAGDGLHALAKLSLLELREQGRPPEETLRFLQTLDTACLRMCEGLHSDLVYQERIDIAPDAYLKMARQKVGSLLGCALELGAVTAEGSAAQGQAFQQFGEALGVAFQVQEDIQMLWGNPLSGKARGTDALNKKKGFPVLYALDQAPIGQKRALGSLFFKRVLEPPDLEQVIAILDGLDARAQAQEMAQRLHDEAMGHLEEAALTPAARNDLAEVSRWLALREETP